ncbi:MULTISPECIES: dihydroorotase [unclassified Candidatus Frackibacter]|uniref:dihydroorotase n=1 Tax=unclassified Candidatus Frackibacter TaxID=2648818 RepID=UPI000888D12C|nr:dihydroorotase [Candidatus Frackibacter sp. WG11]SEM95670.1 dihydroorotase [Candidatus Frackibacter sp. WG12]SFL73627.1 dihydroorotase [Candidatus Frackibacter sp. WG13]
MKKLLIKGGKVVSPADDLNEELDLLVGDGKVTEVAEEIDAPEAEVIDATDKIVTPGLIDMHVHLREPGFEHKEDIKSGTESAAAGGFTSVACMPNTEPVVDNATVVNYINDKAKINAKVNVFPIGSITKGLEGKELAEIGFMKEAGIVAISDDGETVMNSELMKLALEYVKAFDLPVISHCEDKTLTENGVVHEGYYSTVTGLDAIPAAAEDIIVARDIRLAEMTGTPLHIAHVSTKRAVELVRDAKARGVQVTAEVTPHHFTLTDEAITTFDTNTKVNPPLRSSEDVAVIKEGLADGTIDVIATDHAPHAWEEKDVEYDYAPFGIAGLETALPLVITELVKPEVLSLEEAIEKLTVNPAQILSLNKGSLTVGEDADITVIDLDQEYEVDANKFYSKGKNSPFIGEVLGGRAVATIVNGKLVMKNNEIL